MLVSIVFGSAQTRRYPAGGGIYPKRREIPIELETVVGFLPIEKQEHQTCSFMIPQES